MDRGKVTLILEVAGFPGRTRTLFGEAPRKWTEPAV